MTIHAIWFGGPHDGEHIALPDGAHHLNVPVLMNPWDYVKEDRPSLTPNWRKVECPIILTPNGYRIVWHEP